MKKGKIILLVAIVGIIVGAALFFHKTDPMKVQADHINFRDYSKEYQATEEIAVALQASENAEPALVIAKHKGEQAKKIALTFDGMADRGTMEGILSTLQKYKFTGTFFLEGQNAARDANLVALIAKGGFPIGNYGFVGTAKEEQFTKDKLVSDLCKAQKALQITGGSKPILFKLPQTVYDNGLLKAAKACGLDYAIASTVFIPMNKIQNETDAEKFVGALQPGSIVSLRLGIPADIKQETGKTDDKPAIDKKPSLVLNNSKIDALGIVEVFDKVCAALVTNGYSVVPVLDFKDQAGAGQQTKSASVPRGSLVSEALTWLGQQSRELFIISTAYAAPKKKDLSAGVSDEYLADLKRANKNKLATEEKMLYTTERAVAFTFTGFSKPEGVEHVLTALQKVNGKGTFFVSERELQRNGSTIKKIADAGQELAISIYPKPEEDFNAVCRDILRTKQKLKNDYGVDTKLVKQFSGVVRDVTKEAALALQMRLIGSTMNVVQTRHKEYTDPEAILHEIFGKSVYSVGRGWLINIRTDFYKKPELAAEMLELIKRRKIDNITYNSYDDVYGKSKTNDSEYVLKSVGDILSNKDKCWTFPVPASQYLPSVKNQEKILATDSEKDLVKVMQERYIGARDVDEEDRVLGFKKKDIRKFDTSGKIRTTDPVVFITFDDWGTDVPINKLLYVLGKHHAPATFFVLTHNILRNPNLLRAIAEGGHEIGSHTNMHKPMAIRDAKNKQVPTMNYEEFYKDMKLSREKLASVVGDVEVDGYPALTSYFRPPTLAISEQGMEAIFQNGFTYSVSGSTSTEDYDAKNLQQMIERITDGLYYQGKVRNGAIFVMHMSDFAKYSALALDYVLTANENRPAGDPAKFKVGRLADYLHDGYSQTSAETKKKRQMKWW